MTLNVPSVNILPRLPWWVSRWLGYRKTPPKPLPQYLVWVWSFFAAFCGLCVLQAIFNYSSYFERRHVPGIVASFVSILTFFPRPLPAAASEQTTAIMPWHLQLIKCKIANGESFRAPLLFSATVQSKPL